MSRTRVDSDERLARVAEVYELAVSEGRWPLVAVGETFGVDKVTAAKLVQRSRRYGFLAPASSFGPGRCGVCAHPKLERVARALGLPADQLRDVLLTHADGDLRVSKHSADHEEAR